MKVSFKSILIEISENRIKKANQKVCQKYVVITFFLTLIVEYQKWERNISRISERWFPFYLNLFQNIGKCKL